MNDYIMKRSMTEPSDGTDCYRPRADLGVERVDEELLILDRSGQKIHQLNQTASMVWTGLEHGREPEEIVRTITAAYDVSPEHASEDVHRIIGEFLELSLLREPDAEQQKQHKECSS